MAVVWGTFWFTDQFFGEKVLFKATTFLEMESHFKFDHFCTKDIGHNKDFITAISNMMGSLADLYTELGGDITAKDIRKQQNFTNKLLVR